jgi:hypothetical protein
MQRVSPTVIKHTMQQMRCEWFDYPCGCMNKASDTVGEGGVWAGSIRMSATNDKYKNASLTPHTKCWCLEIFYFALLPITHHNGNPRMYGIFSRPNQESCKSRYFFVEDEG